MSDASTGLVRPVIVYTHRGTIKMLPVCKNKYEADLSVASYLAGEPLTALPHPDELSDWCAAQDVYLVLRIPCLDTKELSVVKYAALEMMGAYQNAILKEAPYEHDWDLHKQTTEDLCELFGIPLSSYWNGE